jgi:alkaline phosphatase D
MPDYTHLQRRQFLALAIAAAGGALTVRGGPSNDTRFVSLPEAHKGTLEIDLRIMNQFEVQPPQVQEFYAACRAAMIGPNPNRDVALICQRSKQLKLGGPMLGDLTSTSVAVWMHLPEPDSVSVQLTPAVGGATKTFVSEWNDWIFSVPCTGLSPDTDYLYTVTDSVGNALGQGRFVTAPVELSEKPFQIAFGTCFHKIGLHRPELMKLVRERGNRAMLVLGDSAVDGRKCDYGLINADYLLRNLSPPWQQLTANVPVYALWDDHDYWGNDTSGSFSNNKNPLDVDGLRNSWKTQWNNPRRHPDRKGIYFETKIGPVHFVALDTRSCRVNDQRGKRNSFLGKEQMDWLKQQIRESTSPYILISSGTMWSDNISAGKDSWGTWDTEGREEIFQLIDAQQGSQVILLSGDRHGARGFAIPRPGNKKIIELEVAALGGVPGPGAYEDHKEDQLFGYPGRTWAVGELTFTSKGNQPQAVFRLIDENGLELETIPLKR